jgi:T4 RnlA family RNA ligase
VILNTHHQKKIGKDTKMKYSDMKQALQREEIREREEEVNGEKFTIVSYMVASPDLWDVENATEARGITFNSNGDCVCRTMPKFFNIDENKYTQMADLNFSGAVAFDKLDGSMITPVRLSDGSIRLKTKKSFYSDVALNAQKFFESQQNLIELCNHFLDNGMTPTFEFESPSSQIVVDQTHDKMTLLLARHIKTGQEIYYGSLKAIAEYYGVPIVKSYPVGNIQEYMDRAEVEEGYEGWVFLLSNGQRVKKKIKWYLTRHRLTSYHERNIFDLIVNEEIDDLMPILEKKDGAIDTVNEISHRIAHLYKEAEKEAENLCTGWIVSDISLAEIGKNFSNNKYFGLAIKLYKNQEPDFKSFVVKNYRKDFHTNAVFWGFDTDA